MSLSEEKKMLLSQLVDGELSVDEANEVLADVFGELAHVMGSAAAARELDAMLQLRQALRPWRRQELPSPSGRGAGGEGSDWPALERNAIPSSALTLALSGRRPKVGRERGRWLHLATAALLGGILVGGGFFLGDRFGIQRAAAPVDRQSMVVVTPEQRREIAKAFALHESVAGPLSWYAADDSTIQLAPAQDGEILRHPIAVVLRLTRDRSCPSREAVPTKTYVIVCRNNDAAAIELPPAAMAKNLRLRLLSTETNGQVKLQYVLATDGPDRGREDAALMGRRRVGLDQTSLGQLALGDCLVNVDASAWVIDKRSL